MQIRNILQHTVQELATEMQLHQLLGDIVHPQPAALNICQTSVCEIENYWYFLDGH